MTSIMLIDALAQFVEQEVKEYRYKAANGEDRTLSVHKYYLNAREGYDSSITPYIIVRPMEGMDEIQESTVKCAIIVAVRDEDVEYGYLGVVNILEHLRQAILRQVSIGKQFTVKRPLKWAIDEIPNSPIYTGYLVVEFRVPGVDSFQQLPELYE